MRDQMGDVAEHTQLGWAGVVARTMHTALSWLLLASSLLAHCSARIESLVVSSDARHVFDVDSFGFQSGGELTAQLEHFRVEVPKPDTNDAITAATIGRDQAAAS